MVAIQGVSDNPDMWPEANRLNEFYDNIISGALYQSGGKLISKTPFEIKGLKGVEFVCQTSNPNLMHNRIIFFNNTIFTYSIGALDQNQEWVKTEKEKFFNSFSISDEVTLLQVPNKMYTIGYKIGKMLGYLMVGGIVIGTILFLRGMGRKRKQENHS
ncbi:hypothetical protein D3C80_1666980 [compost metagenome]